MKKKNLHFTRWKKESKPTAQKVRKSLMFGETEKATPINREKGSSSKN